MPPDAIAGVLVASAFAGSAMVGLWFARIREREAAVALAARLGLRVAPRAWWERGMRLEGRIDGISIIVEPYVKGNGKSSRRGTRIRVEGAAPGFRARRATLLDDAARALGGGDHATGDAAFDTAVHLDLSPGSGVLAFDAPTRDAILNLATTFRASVEDGAIAIDRRVALSRDREIDAACRAAVALARTTLTGIATDVPSLVRVVTGDPDAGARRVALARLAAVDPAAALAAATALLDDPHPPLRALAASLAGPSGLAVCRALVAESEDPDVLAVAAEALGADPSAEPLLLPLLQSSSAAVRRAAATALAGAGTADAVEHLLPLRDALLGDGEVRAAARAAVAAIQARLGDVDAGRISLTEGGDGGAVSLAAEPGRLSEARKPQAT